MIKKLKMKLIAIHKIIFKKHWFLISLNSSDEFIKVIKEDNFECVYTSLGMPKYTAFRMMESFC